ncbi:MAG: hypothetical protein OEN52_00690 [Gammaproteobacteria bacterium]|nr:hypothetical protein [Gammaproteobacteria bacterium]MDH3559459.1 hypothetical protein [Gammaproteobacteria bacterium]
MLDQSAENTEIDTNRINKIRSLLYEDAYIVDIQKIVNKVIDIEAALSRPRQVHS